ncbi:hypothetical protein B0H19DRAFT_1277645 [Mycena capillaripes]|nr:hypothetical protein B0H19DRAFT_1277645 [Mycena capillaripes]
MSDKPISASNASKSMESPALEQEKIPVLDKDLSIPAEHSKVERWDDDRKRISSRPASCCPHREGFVLIPGLNPPTSTSFTAQTRTPLPRPAQADRFLVPGSLKHLR